MRCPDCNKFVSFGEPQVELDGSEACTVSIGEKAEDGSWALVFHFAAEARLVLNCAECNTELKEGNFSMEAEAEHTCRKVPDGEGDPDEDEREVEAEFDDPEATDRMVTRDRHGRMIKQARYMKHMYGVSVHASVKCPFCEESVEVDMADEMQACGMDELT